MKIFLQTLDSKQHNHHSHAQGSILVHSSGTQRAQNYLRQLLVPNSLKKQNCFDQDLS